MENNQQLTLARLWLLQQPHLQELVKSQLSLGEDQFHQWLSEGIPYYIFSEGVCAALLTQLTGLGFNPLQELDRWATELEPLQHAWLGRLEEVLPVLLPLYSTLGKHAQPYSPEWYRGRAADHLPASNLRYESGLRIRWDFIEGDVVLETQESRCGEHNTYTLDIPLRALGQGYQKEVDRLQVLIDGVRETQQQKDARQREQQQQASLRTLQELVQQFPEQARQLLGEK